MQGRDGADLLVGGKGADKLEGDGGNDAFAYFSTDESGVGAGKRDVIADFNHAQLDLIAVNAIDAKAGTAGNQAFTFIGNNSFTGEGQVRVFFEDDHTVVAMNTVGSAGADSQIELAGHIDLAQSDFLLRARLRLGLDTSCNPDGTGFGPCRKLAETPAWPTGSTAMEAAPPRARASTCSCSILAPLVPRSATDRPAS